jgi:hypothetical protein
MEDAEKRAPGDDVEHDEKKLRTDDVDMQKVIVETDEKSTSSILREMTCCNLNSHPWCSSCK